MMFRQFAAPPMTAQYVQAPAPTGKLLGAGDAFASVDGLTNLDALDSRLKRFALPIFSKLVVARDLVAVFFCYHLIHLGLALRAESDGTAVEKCAISSYLMIALLFSLLILLVCSSTIRSASALQTNVEFALMLLYVAIATIIAGATGPHRWALVQGESDVCSAAANPSAASGYFLADLIGTFSVVAFTLLLYARPIFTDLPVLSVVLFVVVAFLVQITLIDPTIVPWISQVWKDVEARTPQHARALCHAHTHARTHIPPSALIPPQRPTPTASAQAEGTMLDDEIDTLKDRLNEIETAFNVTLR
jgi:hypothetical protein